MNIDDLIEGLKKTCWGASAHVVDDERRNAATALSTLQAENEKLREAANNWKKKYVEANGKWIEAENKWAELDKAVRNGNVYRPMQEELTLTHEENQSLKDVNEKLRSELEQVKRGLAMMWFAYENKDGESPHEYEIEAGITAGKILGTWTECMPKYLRRSQKESDMERLTKDTGLEME